MVAKSSTQLEEEGFFFEIFVFAPLWEVFFEKFAGHFEADVAFFELLEVVSGVEKKIPDEEILEVVVILFEGTLFFETIINAFESRENVEIFAGPGSLVEDGVVIFEIIIERFVDRGEIVRVKDKRGHKFHIFVDDTIFELEAVFDPPIAANKELPWAGAVADEAVFVVLFFRINSRKIRGMTILEDAFGAHHGEVGLGLFCGAIELLNSGSIDVIIGIDEPHEDAVGHGNAKIARSSGTSGIAFVIADNLWIVGEVFHDDFDGIIGGIILD